MRDLCFCTLALGIRFITLARQLAADLTRFAPGVPFIVLSDRPFYFRDLANVSAFRHRQRSVLGYNDKLCVINKALEMYRTCIFLDADGRIFDKVTFEDELFEPGLRAYDIKSWTYVQNLALNEVGKTSARGDLYIKRLLRNLVTPVTNGPGRDDLRIMRLFREEFRLNQNDDDIPFVVEFLFSITKSDGTGEFLKKWENLANFCERRFFFRHEGFSIGLAALLTGFPISQQDFRGLNFFELLIPLNDHATRGGGLTEARYDTLRSSIETLKFTDVLRGGLFLRIYRRLTHELEVYARYAGIRIFGLSLLS